jgi:hypothetical protein
MALRSVAQRQALLLGQFRQAVCAARAFSTGEQQVISIAADQHYHQRISMTNISTSNRVQLIHTVLCFNVINSLLSSSP